MEINSFTTI